MYMTEYNGKQYVFSADRLSVNGIPIPYSEMSNIAHRKGDVPAFLFDYQGRRFALPYPVGDLKSILPYFMRAQKLASAAASQPAAVVTKTPAQPEAPAVPVQPTTPAVPAQPETPAVPVQPATPEPEYYEPTPEPVTAPEPYAAPEPEYYEPAPEPEFYEPEPEQYEPAPETYEPAQETFEPAPEAYEPTPGQFDPAPETYEPTPESYEPAPASEDSYDYNDIEGGDEYDDSASYDFESEVPDPSIGSEEFPITPSEGLSLTTPEEPPKPFLTKGKLIAALIALAVIIVIAVVACNHKSGDADTQDPAAGQDATVEQDASTDADATTQDGYTPNDSLATQDDTVEATDGFTVTDVDGTSKAVLKKVYIGDDALKKLKEMGENPDDYTEGDDPSYKTVLYEYNVKALEGSLIGDPFTGDAYLTDKTTELDDYWGYSLDVNESKDLTAADLELPAGESATVYAVYGMPADLTDYYEQVYADTNDRTIWVHYVLK